MFGWDFTVLPPRDCFHLKLHPKVVLCSVGILLCSVGILPCSVGPYIQVGVGFGWALYITLHYITHVSLTDTPHREYELRVSKNSINKERYYIHFGLAYILAANCDL